MLTCGRSSSSLQKRFQTPRVMKTGTPDFDVRSLQNAVIYRSAESPERYYTYEDVKRLATSFGEGLRRKWAWQLGDIMAIYAPNDIDFAPVVYGAFYAGGTISTANPAYNSDELTFQLQNSGAKALVTTIAFLPTAIVAAEASNIAKDHIIILGPERSNGFQHWRDVGIQSEHGRHGRQALQPQRDLAFLVYSSGTTGLPKGVMLSHYNVVSDLSLIQGAVGSSYKSGKDKMIGVLPFFHIYGLIGLVNQCLQRGIEMVVVRSYEFRSFLQLIQQHEVTFVYVAPPIIVRLAHDKLVDNYDLSTLRMITSGAAPLTMELIQKVYKRLGVGINQAYGLSETSPMTHTQPWDEWYDSIGSVGKLFPNMTARFMSADGEVQPGKVGELWLAGPNVFQGYWKNQKETQASIAEHAGKRYLKTGDVGFMDGNQNFFLTDRVKDLIKYKGFQVAPTELEGKLSDHPLVQDVAIIGVFDSNQHTEVPRAYIVHATRGGAGCHPVTGLPGDEQSKIEATEIMNWFSKKVANHKRLRGGIRFLDSIPKSAAGKILKNDVKRIARQEEESQTAADRSGIAPRARL